MEVELLSQQSQTDEAEEYTQVRLSLSWLISTSSSGFVKWLTPWLIPEKPRLPLTIKPAVSQTSSYSRTDLVIPPYKKKEPSLVQKLKQSSAYKKILILFRIFLSTIPYLLFVFIYKLNAKHHILPKYSDLDKIDSYYYIGNFEKKFLPFSPHEIISKHQSPFLDFLAVLVYLLHFIIPYAFPLYLWYKRRPEDIIRFYHVLGCFLWIQYFIWYNFPTPPPWVYINQQIYKDTGYTPPMEEHHREGCLFQRVGEYFDVKWFFFMFRKSNVPFGAFPSGHVGWPMCIAVTNPPGGKYFWLYIAWISWSTMYSCHHFLSDVIAAIVLVLVIKKILVLIEKKNFLKLMHCCRSSQYSCPLGGVTLHF